MVELLESLRRFPPSRAYEIIVVDNNSDDFDADALAKRFPGILLIPLSENTGFARGNNIAMQKASGDKIILLNPDTQVTEGALDALLGFLDNHPRCGIASAQLILPGGRIQGSCRSFPWPMSIVWTALRLHRMFPGSRLFGAYRMTWFDHNSTMEVDQPMATCWAMPRRVIDEVGFFDEQFPILFNDVDLAWRIKQAGWEIWFVAEARILHIGGQGTGKAGPRIFRESHRGLLRFYKKNMTGRTARAALWLASGISLGNMWFRILSAKWNHRGQSI